MEREHKVLFVVLVVAVVFLGMLSLIKFGNFIFLVPLFIYFSEWLHRTYFIDTWLAKAIVVMLVVPFLLAFKAAVSLKKKERIFGLAWLSLLFAGCFLGLFFYSTQEHFFDPYTGESMKWYAETPEGVRFFDSPGFDPKYGIELKPVTGEVVEKEEKQKLELKKIEIPVPKMEFSAPRFNYPTSIKETETSLSPVSGVDDCLTFAPGETVKEIKLFPNEWSKWVETPLGSSYRTESPPETLIKFVDGKVFKDDSKTYVGIRRGVFCFKNPQGGLVKIGITYNYRK